MAGAKKQRTPAQPGVDYKHKTLRDFGGMNTQGSRASLADKNQFSWLENVMPLGHGNAIIMPGPSNSLATLPSGTCYYMEHYNRNNANFMFMATTTGHAYEVALDFAGYSVASLFIVDPGYGYYLPCNVAFTGAANVAAVATINLKVVRAFPNNNAPGYTAGDILTDDGSQTTFLRPCKVQVAAVNGSGNPLSYAILDAGDYTAGNLVIRLSGGTGSNAFINPGGVPPDPPITPFGLGGTITISNGGLGYQAAPSCGCINGLFGGSPVPGNLVGIAVAVMTGSPHQVTEIGSGFSGSGLAIAQWADERIIIVDPVNGFFDWNGTKLTPPGSVASITILNPGAYTAIPNITFSGGSGTGAAASPNMGLNGAQAVTAGGTGFTVGDILTCPGGTPNGTNVAQVKVTTLGAANAVASVAVFSPGSYTTSLPANPVAVTGGTGTGCTLTLSWGVLSATMTNTGNTPYTSAPTVGFSAGAAQATAQLIAAPANPAQVEVYANRVWVVTNTPRQLWYTTPTKYNDFVSAGSGTTLLADSTLNSYVSQMLSTNNYLYYTGVDSANVVSDVTVNSNGSTVFSNTNLETTVGTLNSLTVIPYFRSVLFLTTSGIYSLYGATPTKISDEMDGVFQGIDFHGTVSAGVAVLNKVLCACFLVLYNTSGQPSNAQNSRPLFLIFFSKKWFVANQDTLGRTQLIAGGLAADPNPLQNLYGTDGTNLYKLFSDPANLQTWKIETAYWDMDRFSITKEANAGGFEVTGAFDGTITMSVDQVGKDAPYFQTTPYDVSVTSEVDWINNAGALVTWQNNNFGPVIWAQAGYLMQLQDTEAFGKYLGFTLTSADVTGSINSILLRYLFREDM